jgi:hypothetical protein
MYPEGLELEDRDCPVGCARGDDLVMTARDRLHDLPGVFDVVKCRTCGLMRTNPRPSSSSMGLYYPEDYAPYHVPSAAGGAGAGKRSWLSRVFDMGARELPPVESGHLVEIGCASGAFLEEMRTAGWNCSGIEFSEASAQSARDKGFEIQTATVESARPPSEPATLIAAWMVLEHLHEPVTALRKLRTWARSDGYLAASVPDAGSLERRIFKQRWYALQVPTHLYHYSPKTLAIVLEKAGWRLVRCRWQRNCNNLLRSLEYVAKDRRYLRAAGFIVWLRTAKRAGKIRSLLAWFLGITRQSGRIEIWAQPLPAPADAAGGTRLEPDMVSRD